MAEQASWVGSSEWYVNPRDGGQQDAWGAELAATGRSGSQQLREVREVVPPAGVLNALGLPPGERVVVRRRLMLVEDAPVELTDSYYPLSVAGGSGLAERRKIRGGAPTMLAELGFVAGDVVEEISVRPATPEEARNLGLSDESLVISLIRVSSTADGIPFEVSMMVMRPEARRFRYRMKVG